MDFLIGNKDYPLQAEWHEYLPKATIDDIDTWQPPVPFMYKDITRNRSTEQVVTGLRKPIQGVIIETRSKLPFKTKDLVQLDRGTFKVTQVDYIQDENYAAKKIFKGLDYTKAVVVLE